MSLLHQNSDEIDDAALGEEFTKGTSHVVIASIVAAILVSVAIATYFIVFAKPAAAVGEVEQVWIHPQHTETSGFDTNGAPMAKESVDQTYVFAKLKITNKGKEPLFLYSIATTAEFPDGIHTSYNATATDYERIFLAYPAITIPHGAALSPQTTIPPGQTVEGTVAAAFRMSKDQWDTGKDLNFTVAIQYQPALKLKSKTPPTVQ